MEVSVFIENIQKAFGEKVQLPFAFWYSDKQINDDLKKDLTGYSLIVARESLSYNFLKTINKNTVLLPDPAFQLDKVELPLPEKFIEGNTIGINVSPLIIGCENSNGITIKNYN